MCSFCDNILGIHIHLCMCLGSYLCSYIYVWVWRVKINILCLLQLFSTFLFFETKSLYVDLDVWELSMQTMLVLTLQKPTSFCLSSAEIKDVCQTLNLTPPYFLRQDLLISLQLAHLARLAGQQTPRSFLSLFPRAGNTDMWYCTQFLYEWELNSVLYACISTLLTSHFPSSIFDLRQGLMQLKTALDLLFRSR